MQPGKINWPTSLILPGALALALMAVSAEAPPSPQPSTKTASGRTTRPTSKAPSIHPRSDQRIQLNKLKWLGASRPTISARGRI